LENVLGLIQNLSQNLIAEFAPLGLGDLAFLELVELDRVFVCHVYTMHEILQVVNFYLLFFSLFFDGLAAVGWHALCSQHLPCQPPRFFEKKVLDFCEI
jgi:hypothetical protein